MKAQNIIIGLVALTIAVIITVSAVVPVFMETTKTTDTFTNTGFFRMDKVTDGNFTFSWSYDDPTIINVNDETIEYTNNNGVEISVVCSNTFYLRIRDNNASFIYNGPGGNLVADSTGETLSLTIIENSGTVTNGTSTFTFTNVGDIYHISNTGNYAMKNANEPAYMNGDSQIFIRGVSKIGTHYVSIVVSGSIDDGPTISASDITTANVSMNYTTDNTHIDLYKFSSVTFDATYTGDETATHLTYNYVVVPYEVTSERSIHPDGPTSTIINIIPLIIVAGILLLAIVYFIRRA